MFEGEFHEFRSVQSHFSRFNRLGFFRMRGKEIGKEVDKKGVQKSEEREEAREPGSEEREEAGEEEKGKEDSGRQGADSEKSTACWWSRS